jgi:hypothetical protein
VRFSNKCNLMGRKHWNILTLELMQCGSFNKRRVEYGFPSMAKTWSRFILSRSKKKSKAILVTSRRGL